MDYLTCDLSKLWSTDIETPSLTPDKIWVLCAINAKSKEKVHFTTHEEMAQWVTERIAEGCKFIGHNFIKFDSYYMNLILGTKITVGKVFDTFLMSSVYNPSLEGGHSLDDWGRRLRIAKLPFKEFDRLSDEMIEYCYRDCEIALETYLALRRKMTQFRFTDQGLQLEHFAWAAIAQQQRNGFAFNFQKANELYALLRQIESNLEKEIHNVWPPQLTLVNTYGRAYKKDGTPSANYLRHRQQYPQIKDLEGGGYEAYDYVAFNIGSPVQRVEKLTGLGWIPKEFTKKGSPKVTDKGQLVPSLVEFLEKHDVPEVKLIANWIEINARANMINTWMEAYNHDTGCIHGSLWLANSLRYRHSNPNSANIPAVRIGPEGEPKRAEDGVYTYEARDLWTTRDPVNRRLVGVDAKGIQLRVLAHYLNNQGFIDAVLHGDPHSFNQEVGGFPTRAMAKTFIYAFLLGCGDAKAGQIIGGNAKAGKEIKGRFIGNFDGLSDLLNSLERQIERTGRIVLCDGTPVIVTAVHTRLGYLLQGDESRIMKKAKIIALKKIKERRIDALFVGDIHDEWQVDVAKDDVDALREVFTEAFREAGEFFNYRLPIECDSKVGLTWAETH